MCDIKIMTLILIVLKISRTEAVTSVFESMACVDGEASKQLTASGTDLGFEVNCNRYHYGRGRKLKCSIAVPSQYLDEKLSEYLFSIVKKPKKMNNYTVVGEFISLPTSGKLIKCAGACNTALVNMDNTIGEQLDVIWKAPNEDMGKLNVFLSFSNNDFIFNNVREDPIRFLDFPTDLKECGKNKSCGIYVTESSECGSIPDYAVTFSLFNYNMVRFTLDGSTTKDNAFIAIAFTRNITDVINMDVMDIFACIKTSDNVFIKSYFLPKENGTLKSYANLDFMEDGTDSDEFGYFGCQFDRAIEGNLNLNESLFRVYLWGEVDSNGDPILPAVPWKKSKTTYKITDHIKDEFWSEKHESDKHESDKHGSDNRNNNSESINNNLWLTISMQVIVAMIVCLFDIVFQTPTIKYCFLLV